MANASRNRKKPEKTNKRPSPVPKGWQLLRLNPSQKRQFLKNNPPEERRGNILFYQKRIYVRES